MKTQKSMQELWKDSYLSDGNDAYLEDLYETFLKKPEGVSPEWRAYFNALSQKGSDVSHSDVRDYFLDLARHPATYVIEGSANPQHQQKQEKVINLISAYRSLGHLQANIDPLGLYKGTANPTLELSYYGFTDADLNDVFDTGTFDGLNKSSATLREIYDGLRKTYCGTIGIEYMQIPRLEEVAWIQKRFEQTWPHFNPSKQEKLRILDRLIVADGLEKYLGNKYVGQKRFSLEGGDSLIPMLDTMVNRGSESGIKEIVIGMAHRGRLNVLVNILGKESATIFSAFEGKGINESSSGDVKYHLGYSTNIKTAGKESIHVALAFNPSHLEIVSPVVQGSVRCRQRRRKDKACNFVMPIQIHGDAAFAAQGVVMETFSMSQARWFTVGGSVHIVINNQVGFTTSNPLDARSSLYCTDPAKMIDALILHVNGNDPEAVLFVSQLAMDYRNKFKRDVVVDLVCYRRHGHNEADEPSATQPVMYKVIKSMPVPSALYAEKLIAEGITNEKTVHDISEHYRAELDAGKSVVPLDKKDSYEFSNEWEPFIGKDWTAKYDSRLPEKKLKSLATELEKLPTNFVLQAQVKKVMEAKQKMTEGALPINWGYAENLAYATLLVEGYPIRLCGQDAGRGTFAHRHSVLYDQNTNQYYIPLSHLSADQAQINIVDSLLSEEAVLAFEYGYASTEPNNLVIWEAQYGDFANGAQVVIDQFISSGEQKWGRLCGLVMFLPHGYEGSGPEHSSARLERYMQLCAQHNIQVCIPTTPAQVYHMLRRQMIRPYRKPLIVMTPKGLLRNPLAVSTWKELSEGEFELVIPEVDDIQAKKVDRVILCSGKVYFELLEKRRELKLDNVAIIRVEQLYPFPEEALKAVLKPYQHVKKVIWCQEEPENQGAWYSSQHHFMSCLSKDQKLLYAGRPASAAPAVGYPSVHMKEQTKLILQALQE